MAYNSFSPAQRLEAKIIEQIIKSKILSIARHHFYPFYKGQSTKISNPQK
jgi:hypothetical protein